LYRNLGSTKFDPFTTKYSIRDHADKAKWKKPPTSNVIWTGVDKVELDNAKL